MVVSWTHLKMQYRGNYRKSIIGYLVSMLMGNTMGKVNLTYFMPLMPIRGEYPHPIGIINPDVMDVVKNTMTYADYRFKVNGVFVISGLEYKDYKYKDPTRRALCQWIDNVKKQLEAN
nr:MAG TPA: hypothetical protein [Caudoviricetes sp.]